MPHDDLPELVIVGRVRRAHGLRGELAVETITDAPDAVFAPGRRVFAGTVDGDPAPGRRELHVVRSSPFKDGLIVAFEEIVGRTEAELWRDRYFLLPADELEPLGEGEVYWHHLPGMEVVLATGERVGTVVAAFDLPQGVTLEVERAPEAASSPPKSSAARATVMIPFTASVVKHLDRDGRVITIDPPLGLLD